jgi:hypothetical protein
VNPESRITIHMGINFIVSPIPTINKQSNLNFQHSLTTQGIDFAKVEFKEREIVVAREAPTRLEVKVAALAPSPVGQFLILAPYPERPLDLFIKEAEAIVRAFDSTWPAKSRQVISCDATLRDLFESSGEHAFQELWETHLHQPPDSLAVLGRPVLGGGLRFVMPPQPDEPKPVQIEVKIESFLRDTKKIYVETQFKWPQPMPPGEPLSPSNRLKQVDKYIEDEVVSFIMGGSQ